MGVTLYTFEDGHGVEDTFTTFDAREAKDRGERDQMRVVANTYTFTNSETAWDFTPTTEDPDVGVGVVAPERCPGCNSPRIVKDVDGWHCSYCGRTGKESD